MRQSYTYDLGVEPGSGFGFRMLRNWQHQSIIVINVQ